MARLRRLPAGLVDEPWFRALTGPKPCGQSLVLGLALGPLSTAVPGVALGGVAAIADVMRWPVAGTRRALEELVAAGVAIVDEVSRLVFQPWAIHANLPESESVVRSWAHAIADLPACPLRDRIRGELREVIEANRPAFIGALDEGWQPKGAAVGGSQPASKPSTQPATRPALKPSTLGEGEGEGEGIGIGEGGGGGAGTGGGPRGTTTSHSPGSPTTGPAEPGPRAGGDPATTVAELLHARAHGGRNAADAAAAELLDHVGGDTAWILGYLATHPVRHGEDLFRWKRGATGAFDAERAARTDAGQPPGPRALTAAEADAVRRNVEMAMQARAIGRVGTVRHWTACAASVARDAGLTLEAAAAQLGLDVGALVAKAGA